jgi:putative membrane protein insertion efficiency factor
MTRSRARILSSLPAHLAVTAILMYQSMVRPLLIGSCKFFPSCSDYAVEAFQTHGFLRGTKLTIARLIRCHPFATGGLDPVPPPQESRA